MARQNIDDLAWDDIRFPRLGRKIGADKWAARDRCAFIWRYMTERYTPTLPAAYEVSREDLLDLHPDVPELFDAMIASGLGRPTAEDRIYVSGTLGRIEWLYEARENGKKGGEHGKRGGRPRKTPRGDSQQTPGGDSEETPSGVPPETPTHEARKPPLSPVLCSGSDTKTGDRESDPIADDVRRVMDLAPEISAAAATEWLAIHEGDADHLTSNLRPFAGKGLGYLDAIARDPKRRKGQAATQRGRSGNAAQTADELTGFGSSAGQAVSDARAQIERLLAHWKLEHGMRPGSGNQKTEWDAKFSQTFGLDPDEVGFASDDELAAAATRAGGYQCAS